MSEKEGRGKKKRENQMVKLVAGCIKIIAKERNKQGLCWIFSKSILLFNRKFQ